MIPRSVLYLIFWVIYWFLDNIFYVCCEQARNEDLSLIKPDVDCSVTKRSAAREGEAEYLS